MVPIRAVGNGVLDAGCASCGTHSDCGDHCNNCDGYNGPFGTVRKTLACGSGCGEIYYGDWVSNPPNTCNECDATGYSRGVNGRIPWLSNPFAFWGYQYRPNGGGYGKPASWSGLGIRTVRCSLGWGRLWRSWMQFWVQRLWQSCSSLRGRNRSHSGATTRGNEKASQSSIRAVSSI